MEATFPPTHLFLVRHGETAANVSGTWQGASDSPLTERGRRQAELLAARLAADGRPIAVIYSSPLGRALTTAHILATGLGNPPIVAEPGLAEFNMGEWEGLTYEALAYEKRLWERMAADPHFAPPGGESAVAFAHRLMESFGAIRRRHPGQSVLVVSHGGALATALSLLLYGDGSRWSAFALANGSLTELEWAEARPRLLRLNDTSHLDGITPALRPEFA
jgi:broad specificity phosphatase PhoE